MGIVEVSFIVYFVGLIVAGTFIYWKIDRKGAKYDMPEIIAVFWPISMIIKLLLSFFDLIDRIFGDDR